MKYNFYISVEAENEDSAREKLEQIIEDARENGDSTYPFYAENDDDI